MALKDWKKGSRSKSSTIYNKKHIQGKIQKNITAFVYIYNKGWFSGHEDKYVVSTSVTGGSNPADRINKPFKSKAPALRYAKSFMRKH